MTIMDKVLQCIDCGDSFTFTSGEQEFFAQKGLANEPKRCRACRANRKAERGNGGYDGHTYGYQPRREMYPAVCAACGIDTQVPFQPTNGRPVYCRDCYTPVYH